MGAPVRIRGGSKDTKEPTDVLHVLPHVGGTQFQGTAEEYENGPVEEEEGFFGSCRSFHIQLE